MELMKTKYELAWQSLGYPLASLTAVMREVLVDSLSAVDAVAYLTGLGWRKGRALILCDEAERVLCRIAEATKDAVETAEFNHRQELQDIKHENRLHSSVESKW